MEARILGTHERKKEPRIISNRYVAGPVSSILLAAALFLILNFHPLLSSAEAPVEIKLREGWTLQSSCKVAQEGGVISTTAFKPIGWYPARVPSTVLAAQVAAGQFKDPYFGENLRKIPGTDYPVGKNFAELPMPKDSPYACSWWYRTEFRLPESSKSRVIWLHLNGVNYRANIWMNGSKVADSNDIAGAYRIYDLNVQKFTVSGGANVLALEVFAQTENDLGINFVDWAPMPADKDMGLWRDVYLTRSGPVSLRFPQVITHFTDDTLRQADLTVTAELRNTAAHAIVGVLEGAFAGRRFHQNVELAPGELRSVRFDPKDFVQLRVRNPRLWWPASLGPQNLYSFDMKFLLGNDVSDEQQFHFGIREITAELNGPSPEPGKMYHIGSGKIVDTDTRPLLFRINHKKILIRGAGWAPDLLLRSSPQRLQAQFEYVRDMNLNAIRLEGKLETDDFFDLADKMGVLVIAGWCCCDHWEKWDSWRARDLEIASESLRTQVLRLRSHPSLMLWMNGSDFPPPRKVEEAYIKVLHETDWPNPYVSSASAMPTSVTGASGVKMTGPYDYVPPSYWSVDTRYGGAFGFMTETSPGPAIPLKSSLLKMIPSDHLWPIDHVWNFHAGAGEDFDNLTHYNEAMGAIYGAPAGLDDYIKKSQAMAYDGERAMFEAYTRNKYRSTGVIQWMLNNAWPSVVWHLYDYFLQPAGGYFGAKKACEPLHVQYSYADRSVVVVNNLYHSVPSLNVIAALYDFDMRQRFFKKAIVKSPEDSVQQAMVIPEISPAPKISFLKLTLEDHSGKVLSSNFYWLPARFSAFDWDLGRTNQHAYYSAVSAYEDLTMLNHLPRAQLEASATFEAGPEDTVRVQLENPTSNLAFIVKLGISDDRGDEILPALWEDNYFSLLPAESRVVVARFPSKKLGAHPKLEVEGWNVSRVIVPVAQIDTGIPK